MSPADERSRREFLKKLGVVGAAALARGAPPRQAFAAAPWPTPQLPEATSHLPSLNRRALGWLRFLWEKATTEDDWSSNGVPHPWWDRYTFPVVLSYGRFDLSYSTYALLLMADQTPAWREVYTRIADELASRYPTYWGAIDWLTQIGDDPKRASYPPEVMAAIPEHLRGRYNRMGWTANGVEPWGLQPDPVGADGYLFFRAWFNLVLSIYKYISGDDKYEKPFLVTGYGDRQFEWNHHRIAEQLEHQYREHPEGPHCENTKIWFYCNTAGGLGMYLYDKVNGRQTHRAFQNFIEYARDNYIGVSSDGKLDWITAYYDPMVDYKLNSGAAGGLLTAFLMLPQEPELAGFIYDAAANSLQWRDSQAPVRLDATGLLLARELDDGAAFERLRAEAERQYEPRFFGPDDEMFGWWFGLDEGYPRGQQSARMMVSEVGGAGDWARAFDAPHLDKFTAPTVTDIDFPSLGVSQAWNDSSSGTLHVATYPVSPDLRGRATSWRVTGLPSADDVRILRDGQPFARFSPEGPDAIRLDTTMDASRYEIFTGYRGPDAARQQARREPSRHSRRAASAAALTGTSGNATAAVRAATRDLLSGGGPCCPCCQT